jgi:trimeric autotransporter adhesin
MSRLAVRIGALAIVAAACIGTVATTAHATDDLLIDRYVGGETCGLEGDGGPAVAAQMRKANGLGIDAAGNLFIPDALNHAIRRVDRTTGIITTVAGVLGEEGAIGEGDGGPATSARLYYPHDVVVASNGDLYFSEEGSDRVRKVDHATGVITTFAGSTRGASGDGGLATAAQLYRPTGLKFDASGNLYIADRYNNAVRKVDLATGIITTVVGTLGSNGFAGDGGLATSAKINEPMDIIFDAAGNMYVSDMRNNVIRRVDHATGVITTIAGLPSDGGFSGDGGPATAAQLGLPIEMAIVGDVLYYTDNSIAVIRAINLTTGIITTVAGTAGTRGLSGDGGPARNALLGTPRGLVADSAGALYVGDASYCTVRKLSGMSLTPDPTTPDPTPDPTPDLTPDPTPDPAPDPTPEPTPTAAATPRFTG